MGSQVTFDYATWVSRYPEFGAVSEPLATFYFTEATLYWRNDGTGPVSDDAAQSMLLNMLTAHIAAGNAAINGVPASPIVGRITNASEGSVSVTAEYASEIPGSMAWFVTTKYGTAFWAATAAFRTMRYRVPWSRFPSTPWPFRTDVP